MKLRDFVESFAQSGRGEDVSTDYSDSFEATWKIYPKRNGVKNGKKPAFMLWKKMSLKDQREAYDDIRRRNESGGWGKYITDMQRYLRNEDWLAEWTPERVTSDMSKLPGEKTNFEILIDQATKLLNTFCKHQVLEPWTYKGDHTSVTIPGCEECQREPQTLYTESHAANSLKNLKESTGVA